MPKRIRRNIKFSSYPLSIVIIFVLMDHNEYGVFSQLRPQMSSQTRFPVPPSKTNPEQTPFHLLLPSLLTCLGLMC